MRRALSLAALLTLLALTLPAGARAQQPSGGQPQSSAREQQIVDLYQQLLTATAKRDTAAMRRLFAPTYTFVPLSGDTVLTRQERLRAEASDTTPSSSYTLQRCRTQVYAEAAVAHCRFTGTQRVAGADSTRELISTAVFVRQNGRWKIVATHPSVVARQ